MKLFYSGASPFVRKVMATAIAVGVVDTRPDEAARQTNMQRQRMIVSNGLAALDTEPLATRFRFADEPWRAAHPALDRWFITFSQRPEIAKTTPA